MNNKSNIVIDKLTRHDSRAVVESMPVILSNDTNLESVALSIENQTYGHGQLFHKEHCFHETTKSQQLAELIINKTELTENIKSSMRLFLYLLLHTKGKIETTYAKLGATLGVSKDAIKDWVGNLKTNGVLTAEKIGNMERISLTPEFHRIANASDRIVIREGSTAYSTPALDNLQPILSKAEAQNMKVGLNITVTLNGNETVTVHN